MSTLKEAIKTLESWKNEYEFAGLSEAIRTVLPHVVEWPADLTRERLELLTNHPDFSMSDYRVVLRQLAAIAPERKKRVVNLWETKYSKPIAFPVGERPEVGATWRCVARNVELED